MLREFLFKKYLLTVVVATLAIDSDPDIASTNKFELGTAG